METYYSFVTLTIRISINLADVENDIFVYILIVIGAPHSYFKFAPYLFNLSFDER